MPVTSATVDVSIRAEVLSGTWETYGVDRDVEVDPETVSYEADSWGCLKASFTLRRNPWAAWPDLSPFTPIEIEIGGVIVWIGRTEGTPLKAGAEAQINVQCQGWSAHLDDDLYKRVYVHSMLTDWKDARSSPEASLSLFQAAPQVQAEAGVITLTQPKGSVTENGKAIGVMLDLGEPGAKQVAVRIGESTFTGGTDHLLYCRGGATLAAAESGEEGWAPFQLEGAASSLHVATFATLQRFVLIFVYQNTGAGSVAADESVQITEAIVFNAAEYESGGTSVLRSWIVIKDAIQKATSLLSTDFSQIDTAADEFDIPSLVLSSPQTPRQVAEAVNAFHGWLTYIDLERRMNFKPPSTDPILEWGAWSGEGIEDAQANEAGDIYDAAVVTGTAANGEALTVTVTAEELDASTIVGERGFTRAKTISLSNATDETVMRAIGKVWLQDQLEVPFAGAITAPSGALRMVLGGQPMHPSLICRHVNEMLRVGQAIDPSSGGVGRDGRIIAASYEHSTQTCQITLGARTDAIENLLARLAVVSETGS